MFQIASSKKEKKLEYHKFYFLFHFIFQLKMIQLYFKSFMVTYFLILISQLIGIRAQCWKESYDRGIGRPLSTCSNDEEMNGALCYKKCQLGYQGM